jgi:tetratricopeptide (TPR) repeat protein
MSESQFKTPEGFSLFGEPLYRAPLPTARLEDQEKEYRAALEDYNRDPGNPENIIMMGRRTAYLGRHREAIGIYSEGIRLHPEDPRFYRHRGHRFITLRRHALAQDDFEKAALLLKKGGYEEESRLPFNVWYHLGLSCYLQAKFQRALEAYSECMKVSGDDDSRVAISHWLYMTNHRLGNVEASEKVLEPITVDMDVTSNQFYHETLLMYKGVHTAESLLEKAKSLGPMGLVTSGYGLGCWYLYNGMPDKAREVYQEVLDTGAWAGFGYIAAEADLYQIKDD